MVVGDCHCILFVVSNSQTCVEKRVPKEESKGVIKVVVFKTEEIYEIV